MREVASRGGALAVGASDALTDVVDALAKAVVARTELAVGFAVVGVFGAGVFIGGGFVASGVVADDNVEAFEHGPSNVSGVVGVGRDHTTLLPSPTSTTRSSRTRSA